MGVHLARPAVARDLIELWLRRVKAGESVPAVAMSLKIGQTTLRRAARNTK